MTLTAYEAAHPQRAAAPKHDAGRPGYCFGECLACDGRGVYFHRAITLSPSDDEWPPCRPCDGSGRIPLIVDIPGYVGPGSISAGPSLRASEDGQ
jgi:hypothetical protein